jgi:hypothetical protein
VRFIFIYNFDFHMRVIRVHMVPTAVHVGLHVKRQSVLLDFTKTEKYWQIFIKFHNNKSYKISLAVLQLLHAETLMDKHTWWTHMLTSHSEHIKNNKYCTCALFFKPFCHIVIYEGKSIIIRNAVVFVFLLEALSFCAASPCVVSLSLFLCRFEVARSVPSLLPCH